MDALQLLPLDLREGDGDAVRTRARLSRVSLRVCRPICTNPTAILRRVASVFPTTVFRRPSCHPQVHFLLTGDGGPRVVPLRPSAGRRRCCIDTLWCLSLQAFQILAAITANLAKTRRSSTRPRSSLEVVELVNVGQNPQEVIANDLALLYVPTIVSLKWTMTTRISNLSSGIRMFFYKTVSKLSTIGLLTFATFFHTFDLSRALVSSRLRFLVMKKVKNEVDKTRRMGRERDVSFGSDYRCKTDKSRVQRSNKDSVNPNRSFLGRLEVRLKWDLERTDFSVSGGEANIGVKYFFYARASGSSLAKVAPSSNYDLVDPIRAYLRTR
uniref:DUF3778 domain-containing protein n=1 Tax=Steinernema glaseri TaxID=37863 RepID=A0A1I7XW04_9BILA